MKSAKHFFKNIIHVITEGRIFNSYFKIDVATIKEHKQDGSDDVYNRFKLTRPDAAGILVYNEETEKLLLIKQFRYPIAHRESEDIIEIVAGKIDTGETPSKAAARELKEEIGYIVSEERLGNPIEMYASPGYSTEKIYIFFVTVKNSDKDPNAGGGVATEHENIEYVEMSIGDFKRKISSNEIQDAKTIISAKFIK